MYSYLLLSLFGCGQTQSLPSQSTIRFFPLLWRNFTQGYKLVTKVKVLLSHSPAWSRRGQGQCKCWRRSQLVPAGSKPDPLVAQSCLWLYDRDLTFNLCIRKIDESHLKNRKRIQFLFCTDNRTKYSIDKIRRWTKLAVDRDKPGIRNVTYVLVKYKDPNWEYAQWAERVLLGTCLYSQQDLPILQLCCDWLRSKVGLLWLAVVRGRVHCYWLLLAVCYLGWLFWTSPLWNFWHTFWV